MASRKPVDLTVDQRGMVAVSKALRAEGDGKALRKDLIGELKTAVEPGVTEVQGKLRGMPHNSRSRSNPALGSYLASRVKPAVRLSGRSTGVKVRLPATVKLRGFTMAARMLNRKSWRHKVFGNEETWVKQESPVPGYFDDTMSEHKREYRKAVLDALERMAHRIAARSRGIG